MAKNSSQHLRKEKKETAAKFNWSSDFPASDFPGQLQRWGRRSGRGRGGVLQGPASASPSAEKGPGPRMLPDCAGRQTPAWSQRAGCTGAAAAGVRRGGGQVPEGTGPAVSPKMQVQGQLEGSLGSHAESPCHPKSSRSNEADAPSWRATASAVNKGQRSPLGHCH